MVVNWLDRQPSPARNPCDKNLIYLRETMQWFIIVPNGGHLIRWEGELVPERKPEPEQIK